TKKLDVKALKAFRDRFQLPLSDDDVAALRFYRPPEDSPELSYLRQRRTALGGYLPTRQADAPVVTVPPVEEYAPAALAPDDEVRSTTMVAVRLPTTLLKAPQRGPRMGPIVADEAPTFGMANLSQAVGIYPPVGKLYEPVDAGTPTSYREATDGQLLEEGI